MVYRSVSFIALCLLPQIAAAQGAITINLRQPPPNLLRLSDLWEVTITNAGSPIQVTLAASVRDGTGATVLTSSTSPFTLSVGAKVITAANAGELSPLQTQFLQSRVRDALRATSQFPTGDYTVCTTVRSAVPGRLIDLASDCIDIGVQQFSGAILVSPPEGGTVQEPLPVFVWAWPGLQGRESAISFALKIVEVLGRQSLDAAMQRNRAWYEQERISATSMQYPVAARSLEVGHHYAWKVTAFSYTTPVGESEVWDFVYQPPAAPPQALPLIITKNEKGLHVLEELLKSCSDEPAK
jgi:hypothetical protein